MEKEKTDLKQDKSSEQEILSKQNSATTPTSAEQVAQNFRQNSGNNTEDIKNTQNGTSDYR